MGNKKRKLAAAAAAAAAAEADAQHEAAAGEAAGDALPPHNPEELELPEEADADVPLALPVVPRWGVQPRHLLVLDINGLLVERVLEPLRDALDAPVDADVRVGAFHVYNRPGLHAFVAMVLQRFVVGVWSSARQHNLRGLVRHIFEAQEERLAFVFGQEACTYAGTCAKKKPLFLKELGRVWADPAFAAFGPCNTLLLDDDEYKAARNPPHTAIHPSKFSWRGGDDGALLENGRLWDYLLRLSSQPNVCDFVRDSPFAPPGQA